MFDLIHKLILGECFVCQSGSFADKFQGIAGTCHIVCFGASLGIHKQYFCKTHDTYIVGFSFFVSHIVCRFVVYIIGSVFLQKEFTVTHAESWSTAGHFTGIAFPQFLHGIISAVPALVLHNIAKCFGVKEQTGIHTFVKLGIGSRRAFFRNELPDNK